MEPDVSPTGAPVVPQIVVKAAAVLVGLAGLLVQYLPAHTIGFKIASIVLSLGAAAGIVSQGVRK